MEWKYVTYGIEFTRMVKNMLTGVRRAVNKKDKKLNRGKNILKYHTT